MFGADTPLVMDALTIAAIAIVGAVGVTFVLMRRRNQKSEGQSQAVNEATGSLEDRVRVLERIATDTSIDLAKEIDSLRGPTDASDLQVKEKT